MTCDRVTYLVVRNVELLDHLDSIGDYVSIVKVCEVESLSYRLELCLHLESAQAPLSGAVTKETFLLWSMPLMPEEAILRSSAVANGNLSRLYLYLKKTSAHLCHRKQEL